MTETKRVREGQREIERERESERGRLEGGRQGEGRRRATVHYHARRGALRSRAAQWLKRSTEERGGISTPPPYSTCRSKMRERYTESSV